MKFGPTLTLLAGATLVLLFTGATAVANPLPAAAYAQHRGDRDAQKGNDKDVKLYPNASRKEPKLDLNSKRVADAINKGNTALSEGKLEEAKTILLPFSEGKGTDSKYAQVIALQGLANIAYSKKNIPQALDYLGKALAIGVMPNDTYFGLMYEQAQLLSAEGKNQQALDTLHKWRTEGKRETAESYGMEGVIDYQLGKYKEAVAAINKAKSLQGGKSTSTWDQVLAASYAETGQAGDAIAMARKALAANPDDQVTRHNLTSLLLSAGKNDEALKVMEEARAKGQLNTPDSWINMAKLYLIAGQDSDKDPRPYADKALATIKEGLAKGVLKPDYKVYKLEGNAAIIGGYDKQALAAFTKAASMSSDGGADLMRARLLVQDNKYSAARSAARKALVKGTKHKGQAYMVIAEAERSMKNKKAAVAAMKHAAQDPETRAQANAWLKRSGY